MERGKSPMRLYGPQLLFEEKSFDCGYGPRTLLVSAFRPNTVFVGCKDGSVTILDTGAERQRGPDIGLEVEDFFARPFKESAGASAVRALCELDANHLLLARRNGDLEIVSWREESVPLSTLVSQPASDPIRYLARLDDHRIAIAYRDTGLTILEHGNGKPFSFCKVAGVKGVAVQEIRVIFPLHRGEEGSDWILLTDQGMLYEWSGNEGEDPRPVGGIWRERRPSLLSDFCVLKGEAGFFGGAATEALVATDRGLYQLFFEKRDGMARELRSRRLALAGLNATPMALAYTSFSRQPGELPQEFLWVTDLQGDSHLFWGDGRKQDGERNFLRYGAHQSRSETLLCTFLPGSRGDSGFFIVQVNRNDRIILSRYWRPVGDELTAETAELRPDVALRKLLYFGRYRNASGSAAIRSYMADQRRDENPAEMDGWGPSAVLAELYEYLAEDGDSRQVLIESLRAPYAETAQEILNAEPAQSDESKDASRLWRLALLGILHRTPGDQTSSYLGLMRWLRHRQVELRPENVERLARNLDRDLLLVRKWGLGDGLSQAPSHSREDLIGPLRILEAQATALRQSNVETKAATTEGERLLWEQLAYRAELFGRSVNRICEYNNPKTRMRGRTAWATSVLTRHDRTLVAVSWVWGGIEVFELEFGNQGAELILLWNARDDGSGSHVLRHLKEEPGEAPIVPAKYGYSRIVHLGEVDGRGYLLWAPTAGPVEGGNETAELLVWFFEDEDPQSRVVNKVALPGVGRESIYSLLDLGNGRLVAGLRGKGLQAFLICIEVRVRNQVPEFKVSPMISVSIDPAATIERAGDLSRGSNPGRNRMWSLAPISASNDRYRIAFGCDSGEIHEVTIDWTADDKLVSGPHLIGQMGSPVRVLACRPHSNDLIRVFAGGEDGAIVAWQQIASEEPTSGDSSRFGTLWATAEQGAVSQIHLLEDVGGNPAVLAVTREGRYVTFDDRAVVDPPATSESPSRVSLPGSRHGRRSLSHAAFASSLIQSIKLEPYWSSLSNLGAFAVLLQATNDGRLQLVSLHHPEATAQRKQEYNDIVSLWHKVLQQPLDFRLTEAAYKRSPTLSLILVRYLLDHELDDRPPFSAPYQGRTVLEALAAAPWCLPRHLRPLFYLRLLWEDLRDGKKTGSPEDFQQFERFLNAALERAWRLDDLDLFQEICQVVLRQANTALYRAVERSPEGALPEERPPSGINKAMASGIFLRTLSAIEHSLPRWLSADRHREARARISVAKHLVDGETARVLLREAAREAEPKVESEAEGQALDPGEEAPFQRVLDQRIRAIRELVNKRHPLVSLESLRAANLSLARMCRSLVENRKRLTGETNRYYPIAGDHLEACEVTWPALYQYSEELITAAVRAFRTPLELNDALAHEFSRTFALFICACPSATLPIESLLTERLRISDPDFEKGIFSRILAQLKVLRQIGIGAPLWADELVRLGTQPPKEGWPWNAEELVELNELGVLDYLWLPENRPTEPTSGEGIRESLIKHLGFDNTRNLDNIRSAYGILGKLYQLTNSLEATASGLDLGVEWQAEIQGLIERLQGDHSHSRQFFSWAFEEFGQIFKEFPGPSGSGVDLRKIRPEMVRQSRPLAQWAGNCLLEIERRTREGQLFQPEITIYSRAFRRLERAAKNFPRGAAVQTNVVQGILGHHLLEDLDEHALELEEIAEVLNPQQVWSYRDGGRRWSATQSAQKGLPTAERFASYLLGRARSAEGIPKNLRMLQALFGASESSGEDQPLEHLLEVFEASRDQEFAWQKLDRGDVEPGKLTAHEAPYFSLVLTELDLNQRKHAWPEELPEELRKRQRDRPKFSFPGEREILIDFPFYVAKADIRPSYNDPDTNLGRLRMADRLGAFMPPNPHPDVSSSGTGLYLADLAAAIAGWRLSIHCPKFVEKAGVEWFQVKLAANRTEEHRQ